MSRFFRNRFRIEKCAGSKVYLVCLLMLIAFANGATAAQPAAEDAPYDPVSGAFNALKDGQLELAQVRCNLIRDPEAKLYVQASIYKELGQLKEALEVVALLIAEFPHSEKWIAKGELMSALLYMKLNMLDSAEATARQIQLLYEGTETAKTAAVITSRIKELKKENAE